MTDAPSASEPNDENSEISNEAERKPDSVDTSKDSDGAAKPYTFDNRQFDSVKHSEAPLPTQNPWKKDSLYSHGRRSDRVDSGSIDWPTLETAKQDESTATAHNIAPATTTTAPNANGKIDKKNGK